MKKSVVFLLALTACCIATQSLAAKSTEFVGRPTEQQRIMPLDKDAAASEREQWLSGLAMLVDKSQNDDARRLLIHLRKHLRLGYLAYQGEETEQNLVVMSYPGEPVDEKSLFFVPLGRYEQGFGSDDYITMSYFAPGRMLLADDARNYSPEMRGILLLLEARNALPPTDHVTFDSEDVQRRYRGVQSYDLIFRVLSKVKGKVYDDAIKAGVERMEKLPPALRTFDSVGEWILPSVHSVFGEPHGRFTLSLSAAALWVGIRFQMIERAHPSDSFSAKMDFLAELEAAPYEITDDVLSDPMFDTGDVGQ